MTEREVTIDDLLMFLAIGTGPWEVVDGAICEKGTGVCPFCAAVNQVLELTEENAYALIAGSALAAMLGRDKTRDEQLALFTLVDALDFPDAEYRPAVEFALGIARGGD